MIFLVFFRNMKSPERRNNQENQLHTRYRHAVEELVGLGHKTFRDGDTSGLKRKLEDMVSNTQQGKTIDGRDWNFKQDLPWIDGRSKELIREWKEEIDTRTLLMCKTMAAATESEVIIGEDPQLLVFNLVNKPPRLSVNEERPGRDVRFMDSMVEVLRLSNNRNQELLRYVTSWYLHGLEDKKDLSDDTMSWLFFHDFRRPESVSFEIAGGTPSREVEAEQKYQEIVAKLANRFLYCSSTGEPRLLMPKYAYRLTRVLPEEVMAEYVKQWEEVEEKEMWSFEKYYKAELAEPRENKFSWIDWREFVDFSPKKY